MHRGSCDIIHSIYDTYNVTLWPVTFDLGHVTQGGGVSIPIKSSVLPLPFRSEGILKILGKRISHLALIIDFAKSF